MELQIGRKLRLLRRQRDLTQEEAAAHLGISFQAISKWERGEGYPDITMLPALAEYYSVTVDYLLGIDETEARRRYDEINREWSARHQAGRQAESGTAAELHKENAALMRAALKEYPNDPLLLVQLAASLHRLSGAAADGSDYLRQAVEVEEHILRYCDDCEVRGATMYNICFGYEKLGEHDMAVEQARKLPNLYKARENALVILLEGDERRRAAAEAIEPILWAIELHMRALYGDNEATNERIEAVKRLINGA